MNVAPVYYGLDNGLKPDWLNIVSAPPSILNNMMVKNDLDISPVSSVAYAKNQDEWLLLPDLSISCFGRVVSVILVSKKPFEKLTNNKVIITDKSAAAAELLKLLFSIKRVKPVFETMPIQCPDEIKKSADAALIIGDKALKEKWELHFDHVFDLGQMWLELTDLPFVFALWAVRKSFTDKQPEVVSSIIKLFNISKKQGKKNIEDIAKKASEILGIDIDICKKYYELLNYNLGPLQLKGIRTFFDKLYHEKILPQKVQLRFFDSKK
ncbi:MAG: menaquinone biosynthesis protein [Desulfobacteraceae bacterium]|nr:menaquinone biosynthesis protein [Desulfobacteraceae bacterium]MBC2719972.1 menaquinone biosynthesis protein [Desulfobacteraceae bacterium]